MENELTRVVAKHLGFVTPQTSWQIENQPAADAQPLGRFPAQSFPKHSGQAWWDGAIEDSSHGVFGATKTGRVDAVPKRLAVCLAVFVVALGLTVLVGWFSHTPALVQLLPNLPPMTRNAAACFLLSGLALMMLAVGGPRWLVAVGAGIVGVLSVARLVEFVFRMDLGINELLGPSYINVGLVSRGGMAPGTAICFALTSMGLLSARASSKRFSLLLGLNGSIVAAFGMVATIGFWGGVALAAFHTALGFWVLGFGMLALAWHIEASPAGTPRWLPISVAIAVVAGTLGLWRALILAGHERFAFLTAVVLAGGCLIALIFGWTVYLAQRGHAQAAALRRSEAFLKEAQHLSRTGSFHWRVATDEITWSEQLYRIFDLDPGVPVTLKLMGTRFHPEDLRFMYEMVERARSDGDDFEYEFRLQMADGLVKYLHMVAHATRDQAGRAEYVGALQDVTERRLSEEELGKARSELAHMARVTSLGALTASITHEVNQPLSGIITNASTCLRMLAADPPNVDGARETARRTIRDGNRASDVIARLRALFAKKDVTTEVVDLNEATQEVIALSLGELQRGRVSLRSEFADDLPLVSGDRIQLQQVILNLLLNASDAMSSVNGRPRQLVVRTKRDDRDHVRLEVQDQGVGFEPENSDRLFEPFYTTKSGGMGIGLSVSRSIVENHKGRLWARPNDGPGATFSFSIPHQPQRVPDAHGLGLSGRLEVPERGAPMSGGGGPLDAMS
jgi:signal transduction histidine kinase